MLLRNGMSLPTSPVFERMDRSSRRRRACAACCTQTRKCSRYIRPTDPAVDERQPARRRSTLADGPVPH